MILQTESHHRGFPRKVFLLLDTETVPRFPLNASDVRDGLGL